MTRILGPRFRPYDRYEWRAAGVLFFSYFVVHALTAHYLPYDAHLEPASVIALVALFFGGIRLWPVVIAAILASHIFTGLEGAALLIDVVAITLTALAGAYVLGRMRVDPLFRRKLDIFYFLALMLAIAGIAPVIHALATALSGVRPDTLMWWREYIASLFTLVVIAPFLLRWFAKRHFRRTSRELLEVALTFAVLIGLNTLLFISKVESLYGIPLEYFLLLPLFHIALRLRPRFTTLALLLTSCFAIADTLMHTPQGALLESLFQLEVALITLVSAFSIVTTLEEDRRANMNLLRTQMATLKNAVAQVNSESRAKNDFIATLAHELRNPLAPVVSSIELMKLQGGKNAEEAEMLNMMENRMETVRRLLDDLLDISRISEGKVTLERGLVDINTVVEHAILSTDHHRQELHQHLTAQGSETPLYVVGDAVRLEQVFSNLLTNASKYSPSGSMIWLTTRMSGGMAEIEIVDRGLGIDPSELDAIFLPFYQIKQSERSKKGLGIGLSLVRNFIALHDGIIEAKSEGPGKGSSFIVRLPLAQHTEQAVGDVEKARASASLSQRRRHILVVDDNDAAAASLGRLLEFEGFDVSYAYDGGQALEQSRNLAPAAILLDIGLPDQDGYAVAKELRAKGYRGRLIALSGYNSDTAYQDWKEAGFDHYLVKPAGLPDLRRALANLA